MSNNFDNLNDDHKKLINKTVKFIEEHEGWTVYPVGIEANYPDGKAPEGLAWCEQINIRRERGRTDCIASHRPTLTCFLFDAKAPTSTRYENISVELLPLHTHLIHNDKCIYVMEGSTCNGPYAIGFETEKANDFVSFVKIPDRYWRGNVLVSRKNGTSLDTYQDYVELAKQALPCCLEQEWRVQEIEQVGQRYSGDPFVLLNGHTMTQLPHWEDVLKSRMDKCVATGQHVLDRRQQ